jgi:hypothetical protein
MLWPLESARLATPGSGVGAVDGILARIVAVRAAAGQGPVFTVDSMALLRRRFGRKLEPNTAHQQVRSQKCARSSLLRA